MNVIAPGPEPLIREIPLSRLSLAPENVRKTPPDPRADAELEASIAALGLLENLVVRTTDEDDRYAVVAGGRRLKALQALAGDKVLDADRPVPCLVKGDGVAPGEISLAENVVRIAMHPADQVVAFTGLADAGQSVSSIAARFGLSERLVEQRLRLGNAAPELLDAYRADQIDLEVLKAFAVTSDRERQMAVWEHVAAQGYRPSAWQVKRLLTEERVPGASAVARFVGVEAYEAAGGQVMRDLFARDDESGVWFEDPVLLDKLAMAKLQAAADELATRWKWAVPMIEVAWGDTARYGRIEPQPGVPSREERAEIEKLEARYDEIRGLDEAELTDAVVEEAEAIETRLDGIEGAVEARAVFRREDFAMAGCIVTVGQDGALQVIQGLVKPEDMPKPEETGDGGETAGNGHDPDATTHAVHTAGHGDHTAGSPVNPSVNPSVSGPMAPPKDREAEARKEAGVGIGLADDLRHVRTALVKAHLAGDFEAAFDLLLFQMGRAVFTFGYRAHALDITVRETADRPNIRMNDADFAGWSPGEAMLADRSGLAMDWLEIEDDGESFAALRALSVAEKQALFAACVARTVQPQLAFEPDARPELEATVARLGIDFARHVRPTAAMLWSRIARARLLDIARTVFGISWASARAKTKKAALAEAMEAAFAPGATPVGLSAPMHAAALAWTPPGFAAFDTGRIGDGADDAEAPEPEALPAADTPADPPRRTLVVECIESPAAAARRAEALAARANGDGRPAEAEPAEPAAEAGTVDAAPDGNRRAPEAAPETEPSEGDGPETGNGHAGSAPEPEEAAAAPDTGASGNGPGDGRPAPSAADAVDAIDAAPTADGGPRAIVPGVGPVNGHDAPPDPLEIPEFLRRVQ